MGEQLPNPSLSSDLPAEVHPAQVILRFLRAVRYRKGVMVVALAASVLLGALYFATTPRIYESNASLLILPTGDTWSTDMSGGRLAQDLMATYRRMFTSEEVLASALKSLQPEHRVDLADAPPEACGKLLQKNLSVTSARQTTVMDIAYESKDPHAAAAVVDHLLTAYLTFTDDLRKSTAGEILKILTKEKADLEKQLHAKEAELFAVRKDAGEVMIRGEQGLNVIVKRAINLNEVLITAHEKRLRAQAELDAIVMAIRHGGDLQQYALAMVGSVGNEVMLRRMGLSTTDAHIVSRVNQQLLEDRAKLQAKLQIFGPAHSQVREIQERISESKHYLRERVRLGNEQLAGTSNQELAGPLEQMSRQKVTQAITAEKAIFDSYQIEKRAAIELDHITAKLDSLEREFSRINGFYDVVITRIENIDLGQESGMIKTKILSRPEVYLAPVWPRPIIVALISIMLGLGGGLGVVYLQDLLDDRFRSPEELQLQLGLPVLAIVRKLGLLEGHGMEAVHVHVHPNSVEVEAFRTLRTALALTEGGMERLVVSSSEPGDGKTTVAVNLGTAFAQSGKRTLLIDADMRRPGLTPLLDLRGERGLSVVLREGLSVAEAAQANLCPAMAENLDVIPSGPRPSNPTELLAGDRFSELLSWAETHYDQIIVDSPPALVSDTAIIGRLVDGVLLTVRPEKNLRRTVIRATESFPLLGIEVLGIVINHLTPENGEGYYGYGYGYGYGSGYGNGYGYGQEEESLDMENYTDLSIRPSRRDKLNAA